MSKTHTIEGVTVVLSQVQATQCYEVGEDGGAVMRVTLTNNEYLIDFNSLREAESAERTLITAIEQR